MTDIHSSLGRNLSLDSILKSNSNSTTTNNPGILAPSEIYKKLTGSKSKKKIQLVKETPKRNDDSISYIWNPTLEHQFKPVNDLKASMNMLFKKDKMKLNQNRNSENMKESKTQPHTRRGGNDEISEIVVEKEHREKMTAKGKHVSDNVLRSDISDSESQGSTLFKSSKLHVLSSDDEEHEVALPVSHNDNNNEETSNMSDDEESKSNSSGSELGDFDSEDEDTIELTPAIIKSIRKQYEMHLSTSVGGVGSDRLTRKENLEYIPSPALEWKHLNIPEFILENIRKRRYDQLTPVQMQGIPIMSKLDKDFVCIAPTGTGKTLTFILAMLERIKPCKIGALKKENIIYPFRGLVVSPTKVLASQIYEEFRHFTKKGAWKVRLLGHNKESTKVSRFNDILIATPKRLAMAIKEGLIDLSTIEYLIFDEADKLFESGYLEQVDEIVTSCSHPNILKAMFSATLPLGVEQMVNSIMNDYTRLIIGKKNTGSTNIDQKLEFVGTDHGKLTALKSLLLQGVKVPILIFVQSKRRAQELHHHLTIMNSQNIFPVDVIHSSKSNTDNMKIVHQFEEGRIWALIATDVAARGIDFKDVSTVINFDFPYDMMTYIHRIGRTGRADKKGTSITYVTHTDLPALRSIAEMMKKSGCQVADWMLSLKDNENLLEKRKVIPPKRDSIINPSGKSEVKVGLGKRKRKHYNFGPRKSNSTK